MTTKREMMGVTLEEIFAIIRGGTYPRGRRTQLSVAYCHIVLEHQSAIDVLLDSKHYASAFSLARPVFEATVKGLWLYHCATDAKLESDKDLDNIAELLEQLQARKLPPVISKSLHRIKTRYWGTLSSLTHVGHAQVRHWLNPSAVRPAYPEAAIEELANFATFMALVAGRELAQRAENKLGVQRLDELLPISEPEGNGRGQ